MAFLSDVLTGAWETDCGLISCNGDLIAAEETAASSLATFMAPSL